VEIIPWRLGVCVLNWASGPALVACVRRIHSVCKGSLTHLVIVDNASSDNSVALLRAEFPKATIIENPANLGYAAGNNVGARHLMALGCEFLVFLNPDVLIADQVLESLVETLVSRPRAGCSGGVPLTASGEPTVVARNRPSWLEKIVVYGPLRRIPLLERLCRRHFVSANDLVDGASVYAVCGACIAFRTAIFNEIAGFDEHTFLYEEEFITAERLRKRGLEVVVSTKARYTHFEALSTEKMPYRRKLYFYASESYLLRRYYQWNPLFCGLLRLYRYLEWAASVPCWWAVRRFRPRFAIRRV
jgi:GT2 family glycosyltransferase